MQSDTQDDAYGLQATELGLLNSWPDLRSRLIDIYNSNVAALPFVPADWLQAAAAHLNAPDGAVWVPQPHPLDTPWLDTPEKVSAWKQIFDAIESAVQKYAADQQAAGAAELAQLQLSASFWNALYVADKFVADIPGNALRGAGYVADSVGAGLLSSVTGKLTVLVVVAAIGAAIYFLGPTLVKVGKGKVAALA